MLRFLAFLLAFTMPLDDARAQSMDESEPTPAVVTPLERRAQDVLAIFNGEADGEAVFAPIFLDAIPLDQVELLASQYNNQFGRALEVMDMTPGDGTVSVVTIRMERAIGKVNLSIEGTGEHRINGLQILEFAPSNDSFEKIKADLDALDHEVSVYFGPLDGASPAIAINAETQRPLGSAMKLYVLGALGEQVMRGERAWSDVIALDTKSFPSGQMQNWPRGAPVTLHSLASLMISISDNTATDQLINLLGRDAVSDYLKRTGHGEPTRNTPWLTTRELFLLKGGSQATLDAYATGSVQNRTAILATIEDNPASLSQINAKLAAGPVAIDTVEWFANARDLANLFKTMRADGDAEAFRIMAINPALPAAVTDQWDYVGFKGGSETGVLNLTWLLQDDEAGDHILTLSLSDPDQPVETQPLLLIAQRILALAAAR